MEIANLVNQRPIGRILNDPDDGLCLYVPMICYSAALLLKSRKAHSKQPRIQKIVLSLYGELSIQFGLDGQAMFFSLLSQERNGV